MEKLLAQMTFSITRPARLSYYANHSRHPYQFRVLLLISASLLMSGHNAGATDAPRSQREAAVIAARNGDTQAGLVALEALLLKYPDDPRLLADTTIVANWAGNDQLALDLYGRVQTPKDDAGVVEAAARSARNLHLYDESIELYRRAQTLEPERWQSRLGEAMALTDRGDYAEADRLMQPLLGSHRDERDVILGEGYLCSRLADFTCTIAMYQYYLEKSPNNMQVHTDLALALSRLGSQTYALELYAKDVAPVVPETERSLSAAAAGEEVKWGEIYASTRARQRVDSEMALAGLDAVIAASNPKEAVWSSAQFDRIVTLYDLRRVHDAVRLYEALKQQGLDLPTYVRAIVAGAYMALHEPERAEALYRKLLEESPTDGDLWSGLAYAQIERGHTYEALATIDHAYNAAAPWFRLEGMSAPRVNQMRLNLELQAAQMRRDADFLAEAQRRLERLAAAAPANENVRWQLGALYLARGWPLRALEESRIADSYAMSEEVPSLAGAEIHSGAGLRDDVDAMLPVLRKREFDSPEFTRFLREERIEHGWQFDEEAVFGWGSGLEVGSSDQHSETHVYTPQLDNRWRLYGHELSDSGDFGTSTAERTRGSAGVRFDYDREEAWAEFGRDAGTNRNAGNIGTKLSLGDFWTFRAEADSDSFDVPVRAVTGGIHGRSLDLDLGWRASELRSAHIGLQRVLLSDGNQRAAISGAWNERIWTRARWQTSISAQQWESSNSLNENRPYFNPKHDFSLGPRGSVDWLTWQRYDRSFHQVVEIYVAPYWQANYGTEGAVSVHYGQSWKLSSGLEWRCGATWNSQPYDGSKETSTSLSAGITWGRL
jgi:biofilm PGA synthesis protein PgaA